jgi:hypothetical protein
MLTQTIFIGLNPWNSKGNYNVRMILSQYIIIATTTIIQNITTIKT